MSDWSLPLEAGCRCGQVRIKISAPPLITMACHCTGCQRMTASAFSLSVLFPKADFEVIKGEPVIGGLHGSPIHYFCPHCMSWIFTLPDEASPFINLRTTMLDDPAWAEPFIESYTSEKLSWAATSAVHSFTEFPAIEDYPALAKDYAERGKRPAMKQDARGGIEGI